MKRTGFCTAMTAVLVALCLLMSIVGCGHGSSGSPDSGTTFQSQIDAASAGSTVVLNTSYTGTSITISKALTVNGSGIQNLSITVNANVANNVTLTNFVNASVTVTSVNQAHSAFARSAFAARSASGGDDNAGPRELGDDNPKLRLEGSTFTDIIIEDDVTLLLGKDGDKVDVEELTLKGDVEDFVLIENDDDDEAAGDKSRIDTLIVQAGVGEVDLVGARFADLEFEGNFTDKVDFYYDKNGEQAEADFKARLAEAAAQANELDVCAVRNGAGVYEVTVSKAKIEAAQNIASGADGTRGSIFIMLLTDEQKAAFIDSIPDNPNPNNLYVSPKGDTGWTWATKEKPYFDVGYTGTYLFTTTDDQLHTVAGDASSLYIVADEYYEYFDYYRTYSPDALCSKVTGDYMTIWLDVSKLRKSDLNTCAYKADGNDEYYCTPNKLTEIDLAGYKPYIVVDIITYSELVAPGGYDEDVEQAISDAKALFGNGLLNETQIMAPISKGNNGAGIGLKCVYMFPMETAEAYPTEAAVWDQIACPTPPQND